MHTPTNINVAFWQGNTRFYIRGLDYQPGGSSGAADPLADTAVCKRDIEQFKKLGINTIRVYITDNSANHDTCMNALADAGIYVIFDANNPLYSINRDDPEPSYNAAYLQSVFATIDAFAKYTNTLAFFSGNEVVNDVVKSTISARFVKATTRDMRQYIAARGYRKIPVGYSAADVAQNRMQLSSYMNCGKDEERSDFFAFNDYSWCNTDFVVSGWNQKVKSFADYGLPIFLSEYGCTSAGRNFGEIGALMSPDMTPVYSGGLMFEYTMGANGYGIVKAPDAGSGAVLQEPDFAAFAAALSAHPTPAGDGGAKATTHAVPCPTKDANWLVDSTDLPAIPEAAKKYMKDGAGAGPGLKGAGSQFAGSDGVPNGGAQPAPGTTTAPVTGTATPASSTSTITMSMSSSSSSPSSTKPADDKPNAGAVDKAPFALATLAVMLTLSGMLIL